MQMPGCMRSKPCLISHLMAQPTKIKIPIQGHTGTEDAFKGFAGVCKLCVLGAHLAAVHSLGFVRRPSHHEEVL